jgi:hypothetical protein
VTACALTPDGRRVVSASHEELARERRAEAERVELGAEGHVTQRIEADDQRADRLSQRGPSGRARRGLDECG